MFIYKLVFPTGDFYVGKTSYSIQSRLNSHCNRLKNGTHHNKAMQALYDKTQKFPTVHLLEETTSKEINLREIYWIKELSATTVGLNYASGGEGPALGERNHQADYILDDYKAIVSFLALTDMSLHSIADELAVSYKVVKHINSGQSHTYLKELMPDEYSIMLSKLGTRNTAKTEYKFKFVSPTNSIIEVTNISKFARENKLDKASMYRVAKGEFKQYKGWRIYGDITGS